MELKVTDLLGKKVGFFKKLLMAVYSKETVQESFDRGYSHCKEIFQSKLNTADKLAKELEVSVKDLTATLDNTKNYQDTTLSDTVKDLNLTKDRVKVLEREKKDLVSKNEQLLNNSSKMESASDIKDLEKKIDEVRNTHKLEMQKALKDCTDKFMKSINKLDKEKEKLESALSKYVNKDGSKPNTGQPSFNCAEVKAIKEAEKAGKTIGELADTYGVSDSTISRLVAGKTYAKCK